MANHPYNQHREQQVAHRRVGVILGGSPAGSMKHASGEPFSNVTSKTAAESHDSIKGASSPKRYARGGKVKGGHKTNIAIVVPGAKGGPPPGPPMGAAPDGPPPGAPGMPPGMPPPGMPMRARGGGVSMTAGRQSGVGAKQIAAIQKRRRGGK